MIPITFRQKRLRYRSVSDCSRSLNCQYRRQSENIQLSGTGALHKHIGMLVGLTTLANTELKYKVTPSEIGHKIIHSRIILYQHVIKHNCLETV